MHFEAIVPRYVQGIKIDSSLLRDYLECGRVKV